MNLILRPAAGLLNRFRYPHKFLLIGIVVFAPLALTLFLLSGDLSKRIASVEKERVGVEYASALRTLLQHLQEDRGMSVAFLSGDASFGPRLAAKHSQIDDAIKAIDALNERYVSALKITEPWNIFSKRLRDTEARELNLTAEQSFAHHSAAIQDLLSLFQHVGDQSGLELDPQIDSSHLQSAIILRLPMLNEALGQLRGRASAGMARGKISDDEGIEIWMLYGAARTLANELANSYKSSFEANPNLRGRLEDPANEIRGSINEFLALENDLIKAKLASVDAARYFPAASRPIDEIYKTYDATVLALDDLLAAREDELSRKRNLAWGVAGTGLFVVIWLFLGLSLSIVQSLGQLLDSVKRILGGDFSARLDVSARDELGELTHNFNEMSVRLKDHIETLIQKKAELQARNALIELSQHAIQQISMSTADFLSAITLKDFAEKSLEVLGRILHTPAHCLFCMRDNLTQQNLVIAGSARFANLGIGPISDLGEPSVKQRIAPDQGVAPPAAEDHWTVWEIPAPGQQTILIYLEDTGPDPLTIDWEVKALFCNEITTTFGHLTSLETIKRAHRAAVVALADLAEFKDTETGEHVMRVAHMTDEITWVLREQNRFPGEITEEFVEQVGTASILHDVGKVAIPDRILLKPGKLDAEEREVMKGHTVQGGAILSRASRVAQETLYLSLAAQVAESHHEQYDGSGYPRGLRGEAIPLAARIVAVVDVFDALASKRPYKEPWPIPQVIDYIREKAGSQFDPVVVEAFLTAMDRRSRVSLVEWTSEMSVGDPALDNDHIKLIGLINQVATTQAMGNQNYVAYVLEELFSYFQEHFGREETYMAAIGYPGIEAHRLEHKRFGDTVNQIRWQYQQGFREHLNELLLKFLTDWLRTHILEEDQRCHRFRLEPAGAGDSSGSNRADYPHPT